MKKNPKHEISVSRDTRFNLDNDGDYLVSYRSKNVFYEDIHCKRYKTEYFSLITCVSSKTHARYMLRINRGLSFCDFKYRGSITKISVWPPTKHAKDD